MHIDGLVQDSLQYLQCISDGDTTVLQSNLLFSAYSLILFLFIFFDEYSC